MTYLIFFIVAVACSALITPIVRRMAISAGFVVEPRKDRWHKNATPVLGGIGFVVPCIVILFCRFGLSMPVLAIAVGGTLIFILGLLDDLRPLSPQIKFIGQIIITALLINMGVVIEIIPYPVVAVPLTFLWFVGLTNAFNLLDNMDGLSAGVAAISSCALFIFSVQSGKTSLALCSIVLSGSCVGFLLYNFNPARIFMGDCGSMFLGFMLAAISITGTWKHASSVVVTLLVPVLILGIPIFDTAFVTVMRKLRGRPVSQGGRDHISHRLVALGLSERNTVLFLYAVTAVFALSALFYRKINPLAFVVLAFIFIAGLFYFCLFLGNAERPGAGNRQAMITSKRVEGFLVHARRFFEIFMDLVLVAVAYFSAYLIRFESGLAGGTLDLFIQTFPLIIIIKFSVFYYFGLYQTVWRHVGVRDFVNIAKAVFVSSLVIVAIILMYSRFKNFSRAVFVVDGMLTLILITGSHFFMRILREYFETLPAGGKRVLIIGAGDAGEMVLREIRNNPVLKYHVVGFLDDDTFKQKRKIHGVQVLGRIEDIGSVAQRTGAREAVIAIPSASDDIREHIISTCRQHNVSCRPFLTSNEGE